MKKEVGLERMIDHTYLKPDATREKIVQLCEEAKRYNFATVCIAPYYIQLAKNVLRESNVKVCTVVGFPLGYNHLRTKIAETKEAIQEEADEIDAVVNIAAVKSGDWDYVEKEIEGLKDLVKLKSRIFKLIFETALLTKEEIAILCALCVKYKVDYAKTSTGFNGEGATIEVINFMKDHLEDNVKIKASGGIRSFKKAMEMIQAGATRIGTSSGIEIITGKIDE